MTTRKIIESAKSVEKIIQETGITQKIKDYQSTIQSNSNNIVLIKDIASRLLNDIEKIKSTEIPFLFNSLLITKTDDEGTFLHVDYEEQLNDIILDSQNNYSVLYNKLNNIITNFQSIFHSDIEDIENLKEQIEPFLTKDYADLQKEDNSILSIILSNNKSISDLKKFSEELKRWDRGLYVFQQIINKKTPKPLEIVEVSEGSIEIIVNIDFEVVTKLFELFKTGLEVYGAYLVYKSNLFEIIKSYRGNEKLINSEEEREKLLLENVKTQIEEEVKRQAIESTQKVEAIDKKIDIVVSLITDQLVKGNNIKLLSAPKNKSEISNQMEETKQNMFTKNKIHFNKLDEKSKTKLLKEYTIKDEEKYS